MALGEGSTDFRYLRITAGFRASHGQGSEAVDFTADGAQAACEERGVDPTVARKVCERYQEYKRTQKEIYGGKYLALILCRYF